MDNNHQNGVEGNYVPVIIIGGGPVGLACASLLASHGIDTQIIEADDDYCSGSRAVCVSRRSQEILSWCGADARLLDKALPWTDGRSYFRGEEVLHFTMETSSTDRFAPMVNIQQYYVEQFCHEALLKLSQNSKLHWSTLLTNVRNSDNGVEVDVVGPGNVTKTIRGEWLIACDGARSKVREQLGLSLEGRQYEGRYVIVDIEQKTDLRCGRRVWFDPPSNPGSTVVMHQQPDDVWRIDYQVNDDEDPLEVVKPQNVLPRVQRHLDMIGQTQPWKPVWISTYNAKCLTLLDYRHERVLFAGDAAHLVPIFGVRGLNSGIEDGANLAWKLAMVLKGQAKDTLMNSYSIERVYAAHENMAYGAKSTEFMTPPNFGFELMRQAALRLSLEDKRTRSLLNPRQSAPIAYKTSPLNEPVLARAETEAIAQPGELSPDCMLRNEGKTFHFSQYFGGEFIALIFGTHTVIPSLFTDWSSREIAKPGGLRIIRVGPAHAHGVECLGDLDNVVRDMYGAVHGTIVLIRPDGYIIGKWNDPTTVNLSSMLMHFELLKEGSAI